MEAVRSMARDPAEVGRGSTPLELFYDLSFVVAIAQVAAALHHGLVEGDVGDTAFGFAFCFFAIWWPWVNFTWFASAYDIDDVPYRLATFVQMAGILVLAAGIPRAFDDNQYEVLAAGYVIMRLGLVAQWVRVARSNPDSRATALRFAGGVAAVQVAWVLWQARPDWLLLPGVIVLTGVEVAIPVWAEGPHRTPWHPGHIAERYGLFTIIVLGESVLAATIGVQVALDGDVPLADLLAVIVGGLLIVFTMWWVYFDMPAEAALERARRDADRDHLTTAFAWSYGHGLVFAAIAATGAGLAVAIDQVTEHSQLTDVEAGLTVTLPVCAYLLGVWAVHRRHKRPSAMNSYGVPVAVALVMGATFTPEPVLVTGLLLCAVVAFAQITHSGELPIEAPD